MKKNKISILSTRPLPASVINEAEKAGITVDVLSFIETEPIQTKEIQQEILTTFSQSATVVFTSMNAVETVASCLEKRHHESIAAGWKIYCIGNTTRQQVVKYFGKEKIAGTADSATELAGNIVKNNVTGRVIFFCGNRRRNELPDILRQNNIEVKEIEVYKTITAAKKTEKNYDGILFFSPSAVESFFSMNEIKTQTILFAIGKTTAGEIMKYVQNGKPGTNNRIIISDKPGKENLVRKMMEIFREW